MTRPTQTWKTLYGESADSTELFAHEALEEADKLLDSYEFALEKAVGDEAIWRAIEKVVREFDALNVEYEYFIQTGEQKELVRYIQQAAEARGLVYEGDVTEQWRMEW